MRSRSRTFIPLVAMALACGGTDPAKPDVLLDAEYVLQPAGAVTLASGSRHVYMDSARVVFRSDGAAAWMRATSDVTCPCYLGGCATPCTTTSGVSRFDASYTVSGSLVRTSDYDMFTDAAIQSPGPEVLAVNLGSGGQFRLRFARVR